MTLITNRSMIHTAADKPTSEYSYRNHPHSYHLSKTIFTEERITNTERVVLRQLTQVTFLTTIILLFIAQSEVLFYALVRKSYGIPLCQVICLSQPMKIAAGKREAAETSKTPGHWDLKVKPSGSITPSCGCMTHKCLSLRAESTSIQFRMKSSLWKSEVYDYVLVPTKTYNAPL